MIIVIYNNKNYKKINILLLFLWFCNVLVIQKIKKLFIKYFPLENDKTAQFKR